MSSKGKPLNIEHQHFIADAIPWISYDRVFY